MWCEVSLLALEETLEIGKPKTRPSLVNDSDYTIVATYGAEYRGLVNHYLLAGDVWRLNRVH